MCTCIFMYIYCTCIAKTIYHIAPANLFPTFEDSTLLANTLRIGQGGLENVGGCRGLSARRRWPSDDEGGSFGRGKLPWKNLLLFLCLGRMQHRLISFYPSLKLTASLQYDPFLLGQKAYLLSGNWRFLVKNEIVYIFGQNSFRSLISSNMKP